jgi:hypothetical protein
MYLTVNDFHRSLDLLCKEIDKLGSRGPQADGETFNTQAAVVTWHGLIQVCF